MRKPNLSQKQTKHLNIHLDIKSISEDGTFSGPLSVYNFVDYGGDVVVPGAFTKSIQESGGKVVSLWQHDMTRPIGVLELSDGDKALQCKGTLNMEMPDAQAAHSMMKFNLAHGIKTGLSIGYLTIKDSVEKGIRYLKELKLVEGSVVTLAANRLCEVTEVKASGAAVSAERKDFAEELEDIQVCDLRYQLLSALYSATCDGLYNSSTPEEAKAAAKADIAAFQTSYLDFIDRYFSMQNDDDMGMMSFPEMRLGHKYLTELVTRSQALLKKSATTSPEAGATNEHAAIQPEEPGQSHLTELTPEQKAQLRKEIKEIINGH